MFGVLGRSILFPFLALARLVPHLTPGCLRAFGVFAFGLSGLLLPASVLAGEVTLAWDPAQDPSVAGYKLYYGYEEGKYEGVQDVGMETTYTLTDLEEGRVYYFAVVAYDIHGEENEPSEEIAYDGPPMDDEADADETGFPAQDAAEEQDAEDDQDDDRAEASPDLHIIPQSKLSIVSVDSETMEGDGASDSAIDGRVETFWHTARGARASLPPHEVVIALGGEYTVSGFRYLPRQDGKTDGMVGRYSFYVSEDGKDWGKAATTGTFSRDIAEQEVTFPGKEGSFVRFVAHSEVNGKPWTSVAEIKVLGVRR
jgi:hypothetical protein